MDLSHKALQQAVVLGGYQAGLAVVDGLAAGGVAAHLVVSSPAEFARSSRRLAGCTLSVDPEDRAEEYLESLEHLVPDGARPWLVPTSDETLGLVARHRDRLREHFEITTMDADRVDAVLDKERTYELASVAGIAVPRSYTPTSEAELRQACEALGFPMLIKPRESHRYFARFQRKMVKAQDAPAAVTAWREASEAGIGVLAQEFIRGPDRNGANYNSYIRDGKTIAEFTAAKRRIYPREIGFPAIVVSRRLADLMVVGRRLHAAFGTSGFSCAEFKLDERDGAWKLMEINARHNLSGRLAISCGVNFPLIDYAVAHGHPPPAPRRTAREGVYWVNLTPDLKSCLSERRARREYAMSLRREHVFDVLDARDPRPLLTRLWSRATDRSQ